MAGVAPQHRAGSNATTIGMVVAIIVAVALLGVLIWMFTQQEQLRETADRADRAQKLLATASDQANARAMLGEATASGKTVVGELVNGMQLLSSRLTGNQNTSPKDAAKELEAALAEIKDKVSDPEAVSSVQGATKIIRNLYNLYINEQDAKDKALTTLDNVNVDLDGLRKANEDLDKKVKDDISKLAAKVDELQKAKDDFERVKGDEINALAAEIGDKQNTLDEMRKDQISLINKARKEIDNRDKSIEEQSKALADLRGQGTAQAAEPLAIARKPVGKILRALPGEALVHINLGKEDNVTLGMTFSVYSADERIPADGHGKATLEVASVGDRTSECKVVTPPPPDTPILPGDGVGNIVLQRHKARKTRVCVVGQFDINFDGRPDARGSEAIKALAERYGAELVDSVDAGTDYVVVGVLPEGPGEEQGAATPGAAEGGKQKPKEPAAKKPGKGKAEPEKPKVEPKEEGGDEEGNDTEEGGEGGDEEGAEAGGESDSGDKDAMDETGDEPEPKADKEPAAEKAVEGEKGEGAPAVPPRLTK